MGNVGKPDHLPAGKARKSEDYRAERWLQKGVDMPPRWPDPTGAPTGDETQPVLHGGERPGVESRIQKVAERNEDVNVAQQKLYQNKVQQQGVKEE